ncbi:MAG: EAL domain-containing protein [Casimicrobiaceae bacterium]
MEFYDVYHLSSTTSSPSRERLRARPAVRGAADCRNSRHVPRPAAMSVASLSTGSIRMGLQTRILALFLALMVIVQIGGFVLVNTVGTTAARTTIGDELIAGEQVFLRSLQQEKVRLMQNARLIAADYAFREAIATGDRNTIDSVLANHGRRIDADLTMLIGLDGNVIADSVGGSVGTAFAQSGLMAKAQSDLQASAMVLHGNHLYQVVLVPVLAPLPVAWVAIGFKVDDALATVLRGSMRFQVSLLSRHGKELWQLQASTLDAAAREETVRDVAASRFAAIDATGNATYDAVALTRVLRLPAGGGDSVIALLQEPLAAALEPFYRLQRQLALISLVAVIVSIFASVLIARGIVRPMHELVATARRIAAGDYAALPPPSRNDEIGDLASAVRTMGQDIASRESRILDLAYRDPLTDLPNRALFAERLESALSAAPASGSVAVLLMDLDHFKYVNDTLGHENGDMLLREVGARLREAVKRPGCTVARLGGDEFAILLPGEWAAGARRVAAALLRTLEAPMTFEGHVVDVRASVGIAACPEHGHESSMLMRQADIAMYAAKRHHRGIVIWDEKYNQHGHERLSLMSDLRKAVDRNELTLVYQPKVPLGGGITQFVEALVRWNHPTRGVVPPADFIPFAEQIGYIRSITQWVLAHAITQCALWRGEGLPINVSINLSARDVMDDTLPDRVAALLQVHGCAAQWIALEITESAILDDPGHAVENLKRLSALGCKLSIDDYGTGYSSLAYLRRLPLDELKIDKSFVMGMARDASDNVIVRSTIELAHNMGLTVVAEGVEDEATLERLRTLGCDMVQGFFLSRPLAPELVAAWMHGPVPARVKESAGLRRVV